MTTPNPLRNAQLTLLEKYNAIDDAHFAEGSDDTLSERLYCAFSAHLTQLFFLASALEVPTENLIKGVQGGYEHFIQNEKKLKEPQYDSRNPANAARNENLPNG